MKYEEHIEVLHETNVHLKGNEPFLKFVQPGMIVNFTDYYRGNPASHNLIEMWDGLPLYKLQKGEILRFQVQRVIPCLIPVKKAWYKRVWEKIRGKK